MEVVPEWPLPTICKAIDMGPRTSNLMPTATSFCQTEIIDHSLHGFSIVLAEEDAIHLFGTHLRIFRLYSVDQ